MYHGNVTDRLQIGNEVLLPQQLRLALSQVADVAANFLSPAAVTTGKVDAVL